MRNEFFETTQADGSMLKSRDNWIWSHSSVVVYLLNKFGYETRLTGYTGWEDGLGVSD
jgi:hypothetical protein